MNPFVLTAIRTVLPYVFALATTSQMSPQIQQAVEGNIMEKLAQESATRPLWFQVLSGTGLLIPRMLWGAVRPIAKPIGKLLHRSEVTPPVSSTVDELIKYYNGLENTDGVVMLVYKKATGAYQIATSPEVTGVILIYMAKAVILMVMFYISVKVSQFVVAACIHYISIRGELHILRKSKDEDTDPQSDDSGDTRFPNLKI